MSCWAVVTAASPITPEEGPITSVALLLSAPVSDLCTQCRHAASCGPPCSSFLPPLEASFPGPGWVISKAGEGSLLLLEGCNRLPFSCPRNKVLTQEQTRDILLVSEKRCCLCFGCRLLEAEQLWQERYNFMLPYLYVCSHTIAATFLLGDRTLA